MNEDDIMRAVYTGIIRAMRLDDGDCFRLGDHDEMDEYGECADGDCYCVRLIKEAIQDARTGTKQDAV